MDMVMSAAPVAESLAERSYRVLRDRLIMLDIAPGAPINEGLLSTELDMGRTPIREALKKLETDRLVHSFPRRGTFATMVDIKDLAAISEIRHLLEPLAAEKAALNPNPALRAELADTAAAIEQLDESQDRRALMEYDLEVHRLIYRAAENQYLEETLVRLDNLATRIWCLVMDRLPSITGHIQEHASLLRAIIAGDPGKSRLLAEEHVRHFEATIRSIL